MANLSSLFFLALLGFGAFGPSFAVPYTPRQGSNHLQVVQPNQQQQEDFTLAAPLPSSGLQGLPSSSSSGLQQVPPPRVNPDASADVEPMDQGMGTDFPQLSSSSSELQQAPPRVNPDSSSSNVGPIDQEFNSTEVLVQSLTEAERTNLVSYLICEMCRELEVSMCIRMCNGEAGNGTQIEAASNSTEGQQEDGSIATILGDSEDGEGNNSTASADGSNSTASADGSLGGNETQSNAVGSEEDGSLFNVGGDASGQAGNSSSAEGNESGNTTVSAEEESSNNGTNSEASEEFGQSENSTLAGEEDQAANSTESLAAEGSEEEGREMSRRSLGEEAQSNSTQEEDGSLFNVLGEEDASGQSGNSSLSGGNGTANSTLSAGNGTEEASNW